MTYSNTKDIFSNGDLTGYQNSPGNVFWGLNIYGNVWTHI